MRGLVADKDVVIVPPSPNVTLETLQDMMVLGPNKKVGELVSTIDGPFCYIYV